MAGTTIAITNLLAVPKMRIALVCIAQNRFDEGLERLQVKSTDKLRRIAGLARQLSQKECFFCGRKRTPEKTKKPNWEKFEICVCLADLYHVPIGAERTDWLPWATRPAAIEEMLKAGKVTYTDPVYSLRCDCGTTEVVSVSRFIAAVNLRKNKSHHAWRRCRSCQAKWRAANPSNHASPRPTRAAHPAKPTKRPVKRSPRAPLVASIAEQAAAKGEPAA